MLLQYDQYKASEIYHLMTQTIIPRPIAWVLTENDDSSFNVAPFSYFTPISSDPPLVLFSVGQKQTDIDKDTVRNVKQRGHMVIHIAQASQAAKVTETAATLAYGHSEAEHAELELSDFEGFSLPRIANAPVAMGCQLYQLQTIGNAKQTLVIARIDQLYLDDGIVSTDPQGRLSIGATGIDPLARLGAASYASISNPFQIQRPK